MFKCCMGKKYSRISQEDTKCTEEEEGPVLHKTPGVIDLIVIGPSECGKSTVIRHMVYLAKGGYEPEEKPQIVNTIRSNVIEGIQDIIKGMEKLKIPFENPDNEDRAKSIKAISIISPVITPELLEQMRELLRDKGVHSALKRVNEFNFNYAFLHYIDVHSLAEPGAPHGTEDGLSNVFNVNYTPSISDAVHMRRVTKGPIQKTFVFKGVTFRITDVGGERQKRINWTPLIQASLMVIFVAALSDYDLLLKEDGRTNRMKEALTLFEIECSREDLKHKSFFLFLNKVDLFKRKVKKIPLSRYFEDYKGSGDSQSCLRYIRDLFLQAGAEKAEKRKLHVAVTDATDKGSLEKVFAAVKDTAVQIVSQRTLL